jgi:prepilin-type N-terminal cleavage/methylation domain-containing protein
VKKGFTLMEILIVIAIVAILAVLATTVVIGAKRRAKVASCVANQRQVLMALQLYASDHDTLYPAKLEDALTQATKQVLFCPDDPYRWGNGWSWEFMNWTKLHPANDHTTYGYLFGSFGPLMLVDFRQELVRIEKYPVMTICVLHQPNHEAADTSHSIGAGLDGTVIRGMRDGSVQVKRMRTKGFGSDTAFAP